MSGIIDLSKGKRERKSMYEENPKCECGEELEFDTNTSLECNGDTMTMVSHGHCPKCGTRYKWNDYYILSNWDDLEEE